MTWLCDGRQTHVNRVVSFQWLQRFGSHNFLDWFIVASFAFHSYYKDLVSTAAFTLFIRLNGNG
jgi:hypothetical protein